MRYDAFISYRHGELDGLVAEKLHKLLETYRVPKAIARKTGKKRIQRVFRDREELPTSSNLSGSINEALENSEFLLLICSPRLLESKWCMQEVERFGELHGKDRIIALLIDGEPEDAFPASISQREIDGQIVQVEPLAADIRAASARESIKLLKTEKLRLLAPLLGCAYDDLRQRHRARRIRRTVVGLSAALAFSLGFGSFSTYQYLQINRQMQLKLENQSYVLAQYADNAFANGNPEMAMMLALEALPKSLAHPERPYVKAAEMSLAGALGVYDMTDGFKPYKTLTLPAAPGQLLLSPNAKHAAAVYTFELAIFSPETGGEIAVMPTVKSALADAEFLSDDVIVFAGENGLTAYDIAGSAVLWSGETATEIAVSGDKSVIATVNRDEGKAYLYAADGGRIGEISFNGRHCPVPPNDTFLNPDEFTFTLNQDGSMLAVSFSDGSLVMFDTANESEERMLYPPSGAIHFDGGFSGDHFAYTVVESQPYTAKYIVYDTANDTFMVELSSSRSRFAMQADADELYFANENQIYKVNKSDGELELVAFVGERIISLKKSGETLLACDDAGGYHFIGGGVKSYSSDTGCDFSALQNGFALTGSYDTGMLRILKEEQISAPVLLSYDTAYSFSEAKVNPETGRTVLYSYMGLRLYDASGTLIKETDFPNPDTVTDTQYEPVSGNVAVLYADKLRIYSGTDGTLLLECYGISGEKSVTFTPYGVHVLEDGGTLSLVDTQLAQVASQEQVPAESDFAVLAGAPLYGVDGRVFYDGQDLGEATLIGAARLEDDRYAFAIAGSERGQGYIASQGAAQAQFEFSVRGQAEAYFTGGFVFVSELRGVATAYNMSGDIVRAFSEDGYIAETEAVGDTIFVHIISTSAGRYSLALNAETLESGAHLPGLLAVMQDGALVFDNKKGKLYSGRLYGAQELMDMAEEALQNRELSADERLEYRAG